MKNPEFSKPFSGFDDYVDRNSLADIYLNGNGIEIGALHNPLPLPIKAKVKYVDRLGTPDLYEQYPELRLVNLISVDIVDNGERLSSFEDSSQDFIIANHFLEHCEDPIATLMSFNRVLKSQGIIFLALPDKRFTFDIDRERTTLEHLIMDHKEGPSISRYSHYVEWPKYVEPHFGRRYLTQEQIGARAKELMDMNYSIHFHVWEPSDVHELISYVNKSAGLELRIEHFHSHSDEMVLILRKTSA